MASLTNSHIRAIIYYNFRRELSRQQCHEEMKRILGDTAPSLRTIERWYKQFERGIFVLEDDPRPGRPIETTTPETIATVQKLISEDRRITYKQIQETLGISAWTVNKILNEHLRLHKVCTLFVPHKLTDEERERRVNWCKKMLMKFKSGKSSEVFSIVTGDETWLYYYDVPTKSQSRVWVFEGEDYPTMPKQSRSVKKKMVVIFFGRRGIIKRISLDTQRTVTADWYIESCLSPLFSTLQELRPKCQLRTWLLHHDNAPAHRAQRTIDFLKSSGINLLDHPPYSPDLSPCDFALFPFVKNQLKGRKFSSDDDILAAWDKCCASIPEEKWKQWFDDWFERMQKCVESDGKYFEKQ